MLYYLHVLGYMAYLSSAKDELETLVYLIQQGLWNDSAISAHGERRMGLLESIATDLMQTLAKVQTLVDKFRLVEVRGTSEEIWRKIKFEMSQTKSHSI